MNWLDYYKGLIIKHLDYVLGLKGIILYNCFDKVNGVTERGEQGGVTYPIFIFIQFF